MRFVSLFAGIGGMDLGFERAGMTCVAQVEIDEYCRRVLAKHWPNVERFEDVRDVGKHNLPECDVICGGFPCQDLSVAGNRAGLAGDRSGLFFEFARVADELRPDWVVLENVPGLLSSNQGRDFATVLLCMEESGYRCAWRVLDSQYFGVAQRRRRVFVVGHSDVRRAGAVLFEPESGARNSQPLPKTGTDIAHGLDGRSGGVSGKENQQTLVAGTLLSSDGGASSGMHPLVTHALNSHGGSCGRLDGESETFVVNARQDPIVGHVCLDGDGHSHAVTCPPADADRVREVAGLPRGMDGRRYRGLGNAVTVFVAEWIGRRIMATVEP